MRDLQTSDLSVKETAAGAYRIDIASQPNPTVRVVNGKTGWSSGGFNNQVRDLEGLQRGVERHPMRSTVSRE